MNSHESLSEREQDVIKLVAQGKRNKQIASELCITEATVENHLHRIFGKLGVSNRTEAMVSFLKRIFCHDTEDEN